jgi:prepilin-type N-terminal cleavage/methylation domain-containing protein
MNNKNQRLVVDCQLSEVNRFRQKQNKSNVTCQMSHVNQCGLTLIELLIVIAIILVLGAAASPIYSNLQVSSQLNDTQDLIVQTIRTARVRSISGLNDSQHGVYFDIVSGADSITLYQGATYATRNTSYDRVETFDRSIILSSTISGTEVNFSKGLGRSSATGTVSITHDVDGSRSVVVNGLGAVMINN